jgi:geranylgeranyl diphosphate synthase type I
MQKFFDRQKKAVSRYLDRFLKQKQRDLRSVHNFGADVCKKLKVFSAKGKMIRGGLVAVGYTLFETPVAAAATAAGAALELVQSGLLIHDDIMDRDLTRRGNHSIFYQYALQAKKQKLHQDFHVGESLGICAGDIAFFLAYELLSLMRVEPEIRSGLIALMSRELSCVATAQMLDMYRGASGKNKMTEKDILKLYTYKTGRYTFSLPLLFGGLLAQAEDSVLSLLERIGELLGIIFQIKDDELGLFGNQQQIGKPVGSDIKEGKKNLYYYYLFHDKKMKGRRELLNIFNSDRISDAQIEQVRSAVKQAGIQEKITVRIKELAGQAEKLIRSLRNTNTESRRLLLDLLRFNVQRTV